MFFSFFIREAAFVADGLLLSEKTRTELGHEKRGRHNVILGLCSLLFPFPLRTGTIQPCQKTCSSTCRSYHFEILLYSFYVAKSTCMGRDRITFDNGVTFKVCKALVQSVPQLA